MKFFVSFLFLLYAATALGQASFPKGFKLIKGEHPIGEDDMYSNGKDAFQMHFFSRAYENDYSWNDDGYKQFMTESFGFPMYRTKDSLLWGTGKINNYYSYVVVDWHGEIFELFSDYNDADFSFYSNWLLSSIREYRKKGKVFMFQKMYEFYYKPRV